MFAEPQKQPWEQNVKTTGFNYPIYTHWEPKTANATRDQPAINVQQLPYGEGLPRNRSTSIALGDAWSPVFLFTASRLPLTNLTSLPLPGMYTQHPPLPGGTELLPFTLQLAFLCCLGDGSGINILFYLLLISSPKHFFFFPVLNASLPHPIPGGTPVITVTCHKYPSNLAARLQGKAQAASQPGAWHWETNTLQGKNSLCTKCLSSGSTQCTWPTP